MTIVVPYDGTALSMAALERATKFTDPFGSDLRALTVIPNGNEGYARKRDWIGSQESFDPEAVVNRLSADVHDIAPESEFEYEVVDPYPQAGMIASKIRSYAKEVDAELVVIGSDNAGRIVSSVSSVGRSVATDDAYDILIVRHTGGEDQ
jgi:nucleotide-binding universal stress UspA family protein